MKNFAVMVTMSLWCLLACSLAFAAEVGCYNDDSQDVVNQDELRLPQWPAGYARTPVPSDCGSGPAVVIADSGFGPKVLVNGSVVYDNTLDPVVGARVASSGAVALLTQRGSLLVYKRSLETWFQAGVYGAREFKLSRTGELIATTTDGQLIVNGGVVRVHDGVRGLYAGASGRVVALLGDGQIVDASGTVYGRSVDGAESVKLAANGTVVFRTHAGRIGVSKSGPNKSAAFVYAQTVDGAISYKVSPTGHVAYVTEQGRLGRDGQSLNVGVSRVVSYKIHADNSVSAVDADGRAYYFR